MKTLKIETASDDQIYWTGGEEMSGEALLVLQLPCSGVHAQAIPIRISFERHGWAVFFGVDDKAGFVQVFKCARCRDTGWLDYDQETETCPDCKGDPWKKEKPGWP